MSSKDAQETEESSPTPSQDTGGQSATLSKDELPDEIER